MARFGLLLAAAPLLLAVVSAQMATVKIDAKDWPVCLNSAAAASPDAFGRRWGFENGKSCVVAAAGTPVTIDNKPFALCANASLAGNATDAYGRRWGFENGASCVVLPAIVPGPAAVPSPSPAVAASPSPVPVYSSPAPVRFVGIDGKTYAVCAAPGAANNMDAFGRRWGWENDASCIVDDVPAAPTSMIDGKAYPVCADASAATVTDAYGRRWGFENGGSCIVVVIPTKVIDGQSYPVCAAAPTAAADKLGRRWGWENQKSCVYM